MSFVEPADFRVFFTFLQAESSRGLVAVDEFQLDEPIVTRDYFELMAPESYWFLGILLGNLYWKGLLPVKIEQVEIEEVGFFLDTLEFKGNFLEIHLFIFRYDELIDGLPGWFGLCSLLIVFPPLLIAGFVSVSRGVIDHAEGNSQQGKNQKC